MDKAAPVVTAVLVAAAALATAVVLEVRLRTGMPMADIADDWRRLGAPRAVALVASNAALRVWGAFDTFHAKTMYRADWEIETICPGATALRRGWRVVREEACRARFGPAQECHDACRITDGSWDMALLKPHGQPFSPRVRALLPQTCQMLTDMGVEMALLSRLQPGTVLPTHTGPSYSVLRYHLCLEGDGRAHIRVGEQVYHWRPGEHVVFDETTPHSAANPVDAGPRLVLFADVVRPLVGLAPVLRAAESLTAGLHGWR
jgi:quercetin dioxygenase-like cupin family protein